MKTKLILILAMGISAMLFWFCSEKEALEISGYSPSRPGSTPTISRSNLKSSGGSFLPGYQSGNILSDRITLEWQQSSGENFLSYRIIRNNNVVATLNERATTEFTDSNLFQNTFYNYKVAALNRQGVASADTIRLKTPLFLSPSSLTSIVNQNDVALNWINRAEPEASFRIYRRLGQGNFSVIGTSTTASYTDVGLSSGTYTYYVTAFLSSLEETPPSNQRIAIIP